MKVPYDKFYEEEEYFGNPLKDLIQFFDEYNKKGTVLDLGCGQGRDSIALSKMGYNVTGVDISEVGITQLMEKADKLDLDIKTVKSDIYTFPITGFEIVVMDSMLHFYKKDVEKESNLVMRLAKELKSNGILCNCMQKGKSRERLYKRLLKDTVEFEILYDDYSEYPDYGADYHIYIIKKVEV